MCTGCTAPARPPPTRCAASRCPGAFVEPVGRDRRTRFTARCRRRAGRRQRRTGRPNQRYADAWPAPTPYPIVVPGQSLAIALLIVTVVAMLGAGLFARSRLPVERRRD